MAHELVRKFIDALHQLEESGDPKPIASLFAEEATLSNVATRGTFDGTEGAHAFWRKYRFNFREIHSEFRRVIATDEGAALEWDSKGITPAGAPVNYSGVSLLDFAADGSISRFTAYFDPASLGAQMDAGVPQKQAEGPRKEASVDTQSDVTIEDDRRGGEAVRGDIPATAATDLSYASPGRTH